MTHNLQYEDFAPGIDASAVVENADESLVIDARSGLTPSQMVESRLVSKMKGGAGSGDRYRGNGSRRSPSR